MWQRRALRARLRMLAHSPGFVRNATQVSTFGLLKVSSAPRRPYLCDHPPESAMLIAFGGLSAVGKSALARALARRIGAVHLRIDTIEQAMRNAGHTVSGPEGYLVARDLAADNLRIGRTVIVDSVNPVATNAATGTRLRRAWRWNSWKSRWSAATNASIAGASSRASPISPVLCSRTGNRSWIDTTRRGRPPMSSTPQGARWSKPCRKRRRSCRESRRGARHEPRVRQSFHPARKSVMVAIRTPRALLRRRVEYLARIQDALRVHGPLEGAHQRDLLVVAR